LFRSTPLHHAYFSKEIKTWHNRLGHLSSDKLRILAKEIFCNNQLSVSNSNLNKDLFSIYDECSVCPISKQTKLNFKNSESKSKKPFDLIHIDIWGKFPITTHNGFSFFLTIVEDFSRTTWTYLMNNKSMVYHCVNKFIKMVKTNYETNIKVIRSDNGQEFRSTNFRKLISDLGIL